jgi:hypothetical protein
MCRGVWIVHLLVGPEARDTHHATLHLADVGQVLLSHVSGLLSPLAISVFVDYQNAVLIGRSLRVGNKHLEPAGVDLVRTPGGF